MLPKKKRKLNQPDIRNVFRQNTLTPGQMTTPEQTTGSRQGLEQVTSSGSTPGQEQETLSGGTHEQEQGTLSGGAVFLQIWAERFHSLYEQQKGVVSEGKELDNLLVLLAQLCNFKVVHSLLLFDVIDRLVDNFAEKDIELLLVILKNAGFTLRREDAGALKAAILKIQTKAPTVDTAQYDNKSRLTYMLDILMAIRNNNMRKIPNYDPTHVDHLRKIMHNCQRGSSSLEDALRISLNDLLHCEEKGRWWLVGSAWSGRNTDAPTPGVEVTSSVVDEAGVEILDLARKQRMNTDVRKTIFCVLMTSEDYVDAFEKLLRLSLSHQQEREIIHVTLDVCLQETPYNPYYAFIAQKFSECHRRHQVRGQGYLPTLVYLLMSTNTITCVGYVQMTLQFSLWDRFKEMSQLPQQKTDNLADFLTHLLVSKALSLSIFKTIEFAELDKHKVRFMKRVLGRLLVDHPGNIVRATFERIAPLVKLRTLREGLRLFMRHFLLRKQSTGVSTGTGESLAERVSMAEVALTSADAKMSM
ncbi:Nucleolar MIF4G domain-containing protein 1 [Lamellibrachia satsuma]|nr:Nucleolar MIF4G domain-containing protein 1 [Lamellibrachia satsuma]